MTRTEDNIKESQRANEDDKDEHLVKRLMTDLYGAPPCLESLNDQTDHERSLHNCNLNNMVAATTNSSNEIEIKANSYISESRVDLRNDSGPTSTESHVANELPEGNARQNCDQCYMTESNETFFAGEFKLA